MAPSTVEGWESLWLLHTAGEDAGKQAEAKQRLEHMDGAACLREIAALAKDRFKADGVVGLTGDDGRPYLCAVHRLGDGGGGGGQVFTTDRPATGFSRVQSGRMLVKIGLLEPGQPDKLAGSPEPQIESCGYGHGGAVLAQADGAAALIVRGQRLATGESPTDIHGRPSGSIAAYRTAVSVHTLMEGSMDQIVQEKQDPADVARFVCQVGGALHTSRFAGQPDREIVHFDAKPGNVVYWTDPETGRTNFGPCDYGISAVKGAKVNTMLGTRTHAAPEQMTWNRKSRDWVGAQVNIADDRVDSFAISAMAAEMLTGESWRKDVVRIGADGKERDGLFAVERQVSIESGYRPTGDPLWDAFVAAGADPIVATRTPRIGVVAQASAWLAPEDRDVVMGNEQVMRDCCQWLGRKREAYEDRTAHLDARAIQAFLRDDRLPQDLRADLTAAQERLSLVPPSISAEYLRDRVAAEDRRHQQIVQTHLKAGDVRVEQRDRGAQPTRSLKAYQSEAKARVQSQQRSGAQSNQARDRWGPGP